MRTPATIAAAARKLLDASRITSAFLPETAKQALALNVEFMESVAYLLDAVGINPDTDTNPEQADPAPGA